MVRVVSHQRRQIKRDGKPGLALRKQIAKARVRVFGCTKARKLAHRPKLAAIHRGVNSTGVRRLPGKTKVALCVPTCEVGWRVEAANRIARDGGEIGVAIWSFSQGRSERFFFPLAFGGRRLPDGFKTLCGQSLHGLSRLHVVTHRRVPRARRCWPLANCRIRSFQDSRALRWRQQGVRSPGARNPEIADFVAVRKYVSSDSEVVSRNPVKRLLRLEMPRAANEIRFADLSTRRMREALFLSVLQCIIITQT